MLTSLREKSGGILAKIFMGLLAMSFAIWGISDVFRVKPEDTLITAGETTIPVRAFTERFRSTLQQIAQRTGRGISPDEAREMGIDRQILVQLIREAVLKEAVRRLGLSLSDDFIAQRIKSLPQFAGPDGRFDPEKLRRALFNAGLSERQFLAEERTALLGNGVMAAVTADVVAPKVLVEQVHAYRNAARDADYVVIMANEAAIPEPDVATLKKYYEEHKQRFTAPERRVIRVLAVEPAQLLDKAKVSEDDLRRLYEARKESFNVPERRTVEQLRFDNEEEAKKALKALRSGTKTWEQLLAEKKLKPEDVRLGPFDRKGFPDERLAEAVFSVGEGEVVGPVKTPLGVFLARVAKVEPGRKKTFEQVRGELERLLKLEKARDLAAELYDKIEEARASGMGLADVAAAQGLKLVTTAPVTRGGTDEAGKPVAVPGGQAVLTEAFRAEPGMDNDVVQLPGDGYAWFEVEKVIPAGPRPFDKARKDVAEAWKAEALAASLRRKAEELRQKAENGTPLAKIAEELGTTVKTIEKVKRTEARPDFPNEAVAALFAAKPGTLAVAISRDGRKAWLMKVKKRPLEKLDPASSEAKALRVVLSRGIAADLGAQFIAALQQAYDVKINMDLWRRASGAQ